MATQTEYLALHQWEPNDPFLRTDFNEDFAKIDAGVAAHRTVAGTYLMLKEQAVTVHLGFRPKALLVAGRGFGIAFDGYCPITYNDGNSGRTSSSKVTFTDDGFTVAAGDSFLNHSVGYEAYYVAIC